MPLTMAGPSDRAGLMEHPARKNEWQWARVIKAQAIAGRSRAGGRGGQVDSCLMNTAGGKQEQERRISWMVRLAAHCTHQVLHPPSSGSRTALPQKTAKPMASGAWARDLHSQRGHSRQAGGHAGRRGGATGEARLARVNWRAGWTGWAGDGGVVWGRRRAGGHSTSCHRRLQYQSPPALTTMPSAPLPPTRRISLGPPNTPPRHPAFHPGRKLTPGSCWW